jgi:cytoskeletal protein CcmA (bactofilin family)
MRVLLVVGWSRLLALALGLGLLLALAPPALAFETRTGDQVTIPTGQVIDDDLYVAGQNVVIDGTVRGDVFAAGQTVTVNGTVDGSLMAAAQSIVVTGTVRGSARVAAQAILLDGRAQIGRDVLAGAYSLEQRQGSTIGRDVAVGAYQALIAGSIGRNLLAGVSNLAIHGTVGGNVDAHVGSGDDGGAAGMTPPPLVIIPSVPPGLTVSETARIGGKLTYNSSVEYPIAGQVAGGVTWNQRTEERPAEPQQRSILADTLRHLVVLLIVGAVLLLLVPGWVRRMSDAISTRPLPSLGWGLIGWLTAFAAAIGIILVAGFLALIFGIVTLGSLAALSIVLGLLAEAVLTVGLIVFAALVAQVVVSYLAGRLLVQRLQPAMTAPWLPLVVGVVIFVVLSAIPVVGGLLALLTAIMALGALWVAATTRSEAPPPPPPPTAAVPAAV